MERILSKKRLGGGGESNFSKNILITYSIIIYTENIHSGFQDMELILFPLTSYPEETNIYIIQKEGK